jgi:hypothetical protein
MRFETKAAGSNGQAASALVYGLMQVLRSKNLLTADELRRAIIEAENIAPSQPNATDQEVKEMLADLRRTI